MRIFVSYARVDKPLCEQIVNLMSDAHEVWYDQHLHAGELWWDDIRERLAWCDAVVYLMSPESVASEYCQKEIAIAREAGKLILPVLIQARTPIPAELSHIHVADLSEGLTAEAVGNFLSALVVAERSLQRRTEVAATAVVATASTTRGSRGWLPVAVVGGIVALLAAAVLLLPRITGGSSSPPSAIPPSAIPLTATAPSATQAAQTDETRQMGGLEMIRVPEGCFPMGGLTDHADTQPLEEVCVEAFWIGRTEVTNAQFGSSGRFEEPQQPRDNVTWSEANTFCRDRGLRLPTEAEWEYAARGAAAPDYPWGDSIDTRRANYADAALGSTMPVGSYPDGASWVGALDMSGNLWEWVSTIYGLDLNFDFDFDEPGDSVFTYPYRADDGREELAGDDSRIRVLRGGSWNEEASDVRAGRRGYAVPSFTSDLIGFRCAADA